MATHIVNYNCFLLSTLLGEYCSTQVTRATCNRHVATVSMCRDCSGIRIHPMCCNSSAKVSKCKNTVLRNKKDRRGSIVIRLTIFPHIAHRLPLLLFFGFLVRRCFLLVGFCRWHTCPCRYVPMPEAAQVVCIWFRPCECPFRPPRPGYIERHHVEQAR